MQRRASWRRNRRPPADGPAQRSLIDVKGFIPVTVFLISRKDTKMPGRAPGLVHPQRLQQGGTDKIWLDDAVFQGIGTPGAFNAANFVAGTAAVEANDRIIYNAANGQLLYDADGSGADAAVLIATLQGNPVLSALDFQVI